jgi:hypothetical protein
VKADRRAAVRVGRLGAFVDLLLIRINRAAPLVDGREQIMGRHADEHHRAALLHKFLGAVDEHRDRLPHALRGDAKRAIRAYAPGRTGMSRLNLKGAVFAQL